jgi:PAS domain S-box-containing protein
MDAFSGTAAVVVDSGGIVLGWSGAAAELLGLTAKEACGRPVRDLLAEAPGEGDGPFAQPGGTEAPEAGRGMLRHSSGRSVEVAWRVQRMEGSAEVVMLAVPAGLVDDCRRDATFARALLAQDRVGICVQDAGLTIVRSNLSGRLFGWADTVVLGRRLSDLLSPEDARSTDTALRRVIDTGVPVNGLERWVRSSAEPGRRRALSLSAFRLDNGRGRPAGLITVFTDITEHLRDRRHLRMLHEAAVRIGGSLDVVRTAQDLADVLVPALGDLVWVSLAEAVLDGDEPPKLARMGDWHMRRVATASAGPWPAGLPGTGRVDPQPVLNLPVLELIQQGETIVIPDRAAAMAVAEGHPEMIPQFIPENGQSAVAAPLFARGLLLGATVVWRTDGRDAFDQGDADLLTEVVTRGALSVDNARRYTREHRAAVALQRRLLPRPATDTPAAATAGLYVPAAGASGISGDWFDVIPLPCLRVAFVVGDVSGHGLHATATMGRLRTAVHTLAELEMEPDELLSHVDDLVQQLANEAPPGQHDMIGATCLYAVYDPVTRRLDLSSAGHPPPLMALPDGTVHAVEVSPGPLLGVGGLPFETTRTVLPAGTVLVLYTDGLVRTGADDIAAGTRRLAGALATLSAQGGGRPLDETGRSLLATAGSAPPRDDIAVLLARTRAIRPDAVAYWRFPRDPAAVAEARTAVCRQLSAWGLDDLAFTTELVVSELVTNAIRYSAGPVGLRLIHDGVLVCEVSDPSNTQPRLGRAHLADEGGRGLFLVAQLTDRWGCRYGRSGKTIWAEQSLSAGVPVDVRSPL